MLIFYKRMRAWDTMTAHSAGRDMERAGAGIPIGKGGDDSWKTTMMRLPCPVRHFCGDKIDMATKVEEEEAPSGL